jgi:ATP-dependent DNA ligase
MPHLPPGYASGVTISSMTLPLSPPVLPQLARSRASLPEGPGWAYEPKWDGFRAIAFVDGSDCYLQSRNGRPLRRYFPEVAFPRGRYVLDGELVILAGERQDFDALQMRLHPAESRVRKLAAEMPSTFVAFDLLARNDTLLLDESFERRRKELERSFGKKLTLTPFTTDPKDAEQWLHGAEGVVAKELEAPYRPGERTGMVKIKRVRTIDCVIVGWRPGKEKGTLGSLILGLYDKAGELQVVGHTSGFSAKQKRELPRFLAPHETGERGSGDPSRWDGGRDLEWVTVRPELVAEVTFDHTSGRRIRHGAAFKRWREDKKPRECTIDQLAS